jgi:hypothetical protein
MRDARTQRLVVAGYGDDNRLYVLKLEQATGALTMDAGFHDANGKPWRGSLLLRSTMQP